MAEHSRRTRVCHVCSGHPADDARVFRRSCVTLANVGYDVHLIAKSEATEPYVDSGVTIHPLRQCASRLRRMARHGAIARIAAGIDASLYHVHEPELLSSVMSAVGNKPIIYDVHESYLDVLKEREWIPKPIRPLMSLAWDAYERRLLKRCAAVVVVTDQVAKRYLDLHPRVVIVANYPELNDMLTLPREGRDGRTCVFTGTLHANRGLFEAISAIAVLRSRGFDVPLVIAGNGSQGFIDSILAHARDKGVGDLITYKGTLSRKEAIVLANSASIGLVPHLAYGNNLAAWPVKMMEYMALGLPIVYSDLPSHDKIAGNRGLGIAVDASEPGEIADAIQRLVSDPNLAKEMGEAGQAAASSVFNWDAEKGKLISLYSELIDGP